MSSLVFPLHDPDNSLTQLLKQILPTLKKNFENAFVSITPKTALTNPDAVKFLQDDSFFIINFNHEASQIGDHFLAGFTNAAKNSDPNHILHLCNLDRLAFALLTQHQSAFLEDLSQLNKDNTPVLYQRSAKAWSTHPQNYHAAEAMVTEQGRILFGKSLDFTWCHLSLTAAQLMQALPNLTAHDLVLTMQLVIALKDTLRTKDVDWLSWEDPFILGKNPDEYKIERESDPAELEKRFNYVLPEIKYLFEVYSNSQK